MDCGEITHIEKFQKVFPADHHLNAMGLCLIGLIQMLIYRGYSYWGFFIGFSLSNPLYP